MNEQSFPFSLKEVLLREACERNLFVCMLRRYLEARLRSVSLEVIFMCLQTQDRGF